MIPAAGTEAPSRIQVTVPTGAFYQSPQLFDVLPGTGPSQGGMLLTLTGANFGTAVSGAVRFGPIEVPMIYVDPGQRVRSPRRCLRGPRTM